MKKVLPRLLPITAFALVLAVFSLNVTTAPTAKAGNALEKYANQPLNALAKEASPYLVQHSRDLVDWNSWNEATLERARRSGKQIFLSIGYSACTWCHVMQLESFNDPKIAKLLNQRFIPILIDREQRADLDQTYMLATEEIAGQAGWPNNLILTPDLKPFLAGIYFPPADLTKWLSDASSNWLSDQASVEKKAEAIASKLANLASQQKQAKELTQQVVQQATEELIGQFDPFNGGIGIAPKHFNTPTLQFLLQQAGKPDGEEARETLVATLSAIAKGGVRDHLIGGFHRYATDNNWRLPHFEKMLYDQAQLSEIFTRTAALTGDPFMAKVARSTLDYVLADLTSPSGGFYATIDSDSEGGEGTYYTWSAEQLQKTLGDSDAQFVLENIGTISEGDFADTVILHRDTDFDKNSQARYETILVKLLAARKQRIAPHRDEKIVASWNGLMISAFATASRQFDDRRYGAAARKAAEFIWANMRTDNGDLLANFFQNKAGVTGTLPDYAFIAKAFIDLYDLTGDNKWLERAKKLAARMEDNFKDQEIGDYFFATTKQGFTRLKLRADDALPSGNAMALVVAEKLARRSLDPEYARRAETLITTLSGDAVADPRGGATVLASAERFLRGENGPLQYAARGRVKVAATLNRERTMMRVQVTLAPDWHVNADKPFEDAFIPTRLSLKAANDSNSSAPVTYPKFVSRILGFQDKPLALFENRFELTMTLPEPATKTVTGMLELQACNQELCLLPETLTLKVTPILTQ